LFENSSDLGVARIADILRASPIFGSLRPVCLPSVVVKNGLALTTARFTPSVIFQLSSDIRKLSLTCERLRYHAMNSTVRPPSGSAWPPILRSLMVRCQHLACAVNARAVGS
jgi:hypothetical protein